MRLGHQRINLADLVHREHATPFLLHKWEGAPHERRADRKPCIPAPTAPLLHDNTISKVLEQQKFSDSGL
jgi:hypothetical protein